MTFSWIYSTEWRHWFCRVNSMKRYLHSRFFFSLSFNRITTHSNVNLSKSCFKLETRNHYYFILQFCILRHKQISFHSFSSKDYKNERRHQRNHSERHGHPGAGANHQGVDHWRPEERSLHLLPRILHGTLSFSRTQNNLTEGTIWLTRVS